MIIGLNWIKEGQFIEVKYNREPQEGKTDRRIQRNIERSVEVEIGKKSRQSRRFWSVLDTSWNN